MGQGVNILGFVGQVVSMATNDTIAAQKEL